MIHVLVEAVRSTRSAVVRLLNQWISKGIHYVDALFVRKGYKNDKD